MRYEKTTLEDWQCRSFDHQYAKDQCLDALNNSKNLIMLGNMGTGKTMMAHALVNKVGGEVAVVSKMLRLIMEAVQGKSERTCSELMNCASTVPLFVFDEFGVDELTPAQFRYINEIIDSRYMNELPTAFVSNLDFDSFKAMVGPRVMDRLKGVNVVIFGWDSER